MRKQQKTDIIYKMINSRFIEPIAEYVYAHYAKRFDEGNGLKSVEVRIANVKKQIDDCATAFVEAKNATLRNSIEVKIADLEKTLECLLKERAKIEQVQKKRPTMQDALDIVKKFFASDMSDKKFRKILIDIMVKKVMCADDGLVIYYNLVD